MQFFRNFRYDRGEKLSLQLSGLPIPRGLSVKPGNMTPFHTHAFVKQRSSQEGRGFIVIKIRNALSRSKTSLYFSLCKLYRYR